MTGKERIRTVLEGEPPDRVPLFELCITPHFIEDLGNGNIYQAYGALGLDMAVIWPEVPQITFDDSEECVDVFGRLFRRDRTPGTWGFNYVTGRLKTWDDLERFTPKLDLEVFLPSAKVRRLIEERPDTAFAFVYNGPLELTYEAMGIETFSVAVCEDPDLVRELLRRRTDLFLAVARHAVDLGVDCVFIGDDAAFKGSSFLSPAMFDEFVIPCYRRIVHAMSAPVLWHSDGFIEPLLPSIAEAGIAGVHPLEPVAGVDMGRVKQQFGNRLILIGNVCCSTVLTQPDLCRVRADVDRCMREAKDGGNYILSSSNSLHAGVEVQVALEMYRYAREVGGY